MKMLIDKLKLKLLLEQKRDYIRNSLEGLDILVSAILYIVSLLCSDFKSVLGIPVMVIETLAWVLAAILLLYGIYKLRWSKKHQYTHEMLYHDIENLNEVLHRFSLVALKNDFEKFPNKYLLYYDKSWECWFFFSFRTSEYDNEENLAQRLSNKLKIERKCIFVRYISDRIQPKFSEKDQVQKVYQHSLYQGKIYSFPEEMLQDEFEIDGVRYRWWTIEQMEADKEIMRKNADVVAFVKDKIQ